MRYLHRATTEKGFIDLHNHTNLSYGHEMGKMNISPVQFLEEMREYADEFGVVVTFSVTDHNDVISNIKIMHEIETNPEKYKNIRYIPGVEYSVSADSLGVCYDKNGNKQPIIKNNRVHLLAYGMDTKNPDIKYLNMLMSTSSTFTVKFLPYDMPIKYGNIIFATQKWLKDRNILKGIPDFREHCPLQTTFRDTLAIVERYLKDEIKLDDKSLKEWNSYINDYWNLAKNTKADIMEVMSIVEQAGGYCVLAHPLAYTPSETFESICRNKDTTDPRNRDYVDISFDDTNYKTMDPSEKRRNLRRMENYYDFLYRKLSIEAKNPITGEKIQGIIGHELLHPLNQINPYKFQTLLQTGDKYGLYCTGGSDSHGDFYEYCFPSRIAGAMVQKYDSNYDSKISAYCLVHCLFVEDYFKSKEMGVRLDRELGREGRNQLIVLKTDEKGEKYYDTNKFMEVIFTSFDRKKQDWANNKSKSDEYELAEQQIQQV